MNTKIMLVVMALCTSAVVKAECERKPTPEQKHIENERVATKLEMRREVAAKYWAVQKLTASK